MIETWIDTLAAVWEISDRRFGTVRSYKVVEKAEFPASIDPKDLDKSPVALTIPGTLTPEYSEGGPQFGFWIGVTEFHVSSDLDYARLPTLIPWYGLILKAAAAHAKLGGLVELFNIDQPGIVGPVGLTYGNEATHWGFNVHWKVKERFEGQLTMGR